MSRNETNVPDPEVVPTVERRRFTAQEKLRILKDLSQLEEILRPCVMKVSETSVGAGADAQGLARQDGTG